MITRRQFSHTVLAALAGPALASSRSGASPVAGVRLGVQTYSFRELTSGATGDAVDLIVGAMKACGVDECELWSPQIESGGIVRGASPEEARASLRRWRLSTAPSHFAGIRQKFDAAGMTIYAYNLSFNESFTDEEVDRGFEAARALGAEVITASTTLRVARRLVPFAERHQLPVAMHNHSRLDDPNEFATPLSFATALAMSPLYRINLDIGHFTAANFDALSFLEEHHDRISNLHLKDRRRNQGDNVPWGQGDTPIGQVLDWLKERRSAVRAYVEYEYKGVLGPVEETRTCVEYAKRALVS